LRLEIKPTQARLKILESDSHMAEYIYIAESSQYPGMVKIGRTDRAVDIRMDELSEQNYGISGSEMESEWEAVKVIQVEDNEHAEEVLHEHFSDMRVDDSRELFYSDDPVGLAYEAETIVDGTILTSDLIEIANLFDPLSLVALSAAITFSARTFAPENKNTKKAEKFMREWELRTERRYKNSKNEISKFIFGGLNEIFKINKSLGEGTSKFIGAIAEEFGIKRNVSLEKSKQLPPKPKISESINCEFGHPAIKRKNSYTGEFFWGCSKFPQCRWTKNI